MLKVMMHKHLLIRRVVVVDLPSWYAFFDRRDADNVVEWFAFFVLIKCPWREHMTRSPELSQMMNRKLLLLAEAEIFEFDCDCEEEPC